MNHLIKKIMKNLINFQQKIFLIARNKTSLLMI